MASRRPTEPPRSPEVAKEIPKVIKADEKVAPTAPTSTRAKPPTPRVRKMAAKAPARVTISEDVRRGMIAEGAYLRAERRGFAPGHEEEDWIAAEAEVDAQRSDWRRVADTESSRQVGDKQTDVELFDRDVRGIDENDAPQVSVDRRTKLDGRLPQRETSARDEAKPFVVGLPDAFGAPTLLGHLRKMRYSVSKQAQRKIKGASRRAKNIARPVSRTLEKLTRLHATESDTRRKTFQDVYERNLWGSDSGSKFFSG